MLNLLSVVWCLVREKNILLPTVTDLKSGRERARICERHTFCVFGRFIGNVWPRQIGQNSWNGHLDITQSKGKYFI